MLCLCLCTSVQPCYVVTSTHISSIIFKIVTVPKAPLKPDREISKPAYTICLCLFKRKNITKLARTTKPLINIIKGENKALHSKPKSCWDLSKWSALEMRIQPLLLLAEQETSRIIGEIKNFRWPIDLQNNSLFERNQTQHT